MEISLQKTIVERTQITVSPLLAADSRVWLFQDLSLQEGYPRPLSDISLGTGDGETAPGLNGLVWDTEEGPVWGAIGEPAEKENHTWASLLQAGVNGITTDTGGETLCPVSYILCPMSCVLFLCPLRAEASWVCCLGSWHGERQTNTEK